MGALTHKEREGLEEVFLSIQSKNKHNLFFRIKSVLKLLHSHIRKSFYAKIIKKGM